MAPEAFAPAFAFACSRLSDSEPLRAAPYVADRCRCSRSAYMSESMQRVLCRVRVHFYKNIYYFVYFIPKNVQNARYFAFFAQNIWQFQKKALPLQRI